MADENKTGVDVNTKPSEAFENQSPAQGAEGKPATKENTPNNRGGANRGGGRDNRGGGQKFSCKFHDDSSQSVSIQ